YSLGGLNIPQNKKYVLPLGSFPIYDANGTVTITNQHVLDNPYFPTKASDKLILLSGKDTKIEHTVSQITFTPGDSNEKNYITKASGNLAGTARTFKKNDKPLIYKFNVADCNNIGIDMEMSGDSYTVAVSPDGKTWFERLNTWSDTPTKHSLDISFLAGNPDELIKLFVTAAPDDADIIAKQKNTKIEREHCRYVNDGGFFVYKLQLPQVSECHLELVAANAYKVEFSKDGRVWQEELNANQVKPRKGEKLADAAWLRIVDITKYLNKTGCVYMKFSDSGDTASYGGKGAFLRRLTAYGVFDSKDIYVKFANATYGNQNGFAINKLTLRKWNR
ncbi:MAG TPA: hypothetical protein VIJ25_15000, partial [Methylococcales bacterium]